MYTPDSLDAFNIYDDDLIMSDKELPHCDHCGDTIYEEYYYINGETICEDCMESYKIKI